MYYYYLSSHNLLDNFKCNFPQFTFRKNTQRKSDTKRAFSELRILRGFRHMSARPVSHTEICQQDRV